MSFAIEHPGIRQLILVQKELAGGVDISLPASRHQKLIEFSSDGNWRDFLNEVEIELMAGVRCRAFVFCSIKIAAYIRRHLPMLNRHMFYQPADLSFSRVAAAVPLHLQLNRSFVLLPFGALKDRKEQLYGLFGESVFLRPDDSRKVFAGTTVALDDFDHEINAIEQIFKIQSDQLCVVDRAQPISDHEFRFWLASGRILSFAGYAHDKFARQVCPAEIWDLAERISQYIDPWFDPVVADFVMDGDGIPRLIEMNSVSTSGFYPGMAFVNLIDGLEQLHL